MISFDQFGNVRFIDIETGGLTANSPILSVGQSVGGPVRVMYSTPAEGSFISKFARERIIPLAEKTRLASGGKLLEEKELLIELLNDLEAFSQTENPVLAGWNIGERSILAPGVNGFDIPMILARAQKYGLTSRFNQVLDKITIRDLAQEFVVQLSSTIYQETKNLSPEELAAKYDPDLIKQMYPLGKEAAGLFAQGKNVSEVVDLIDRKKVAGWTQEIAAKLFGITSAEAHEVSSDVATLAKIYASKGEISVKQWHDLALQNRLISAAKAATERNETINWDEFRTRAAKTETSWEQIEKAIQEELPFSKRNAGEIVGAPLRSITQVSPNRKFKIAAGIIGGLGLLSWLKPLSLFSGDDVGDLEDITKVPALPGGAVAGDDTNIPFAKQPIPDALMGQLIDPRIREFRRDIWDDPTIRGNLQAQLQKEEAETQAKMGQLLDSDLIAANASEIEALNEKGKQLKRIILDQFIMDVEDADTLVLRRSGIANWLKAKFGYGQISIRLAGIDAPETAGHSEGSLLSQLRINQEQPGGQEATAELRKLLAENPAASVIIDPSQMTYGRYLGAVVSDKTNLNVELIRRGAVSALPFGEASEELVTRKHTAQAELAAREQGIGMWGLARYQAIAEAKQQMGQPITYNTFASIDKLSENLNLGAYQSFLYSLGDQDRQLTEEEFIKARMMGRKLRKSMWRKDKKQSDKQAWGDKFSFNIIEGMSEVGLSAKIRHLMTPFGSGFISTLADKAARILPEERISKILSAAPEAAESEMQSLIKEGLGEKLKVSVGETEAYVLNKLGSGAQGVAYNAWVPGKGKAVLKTELPHLAGAKIQGFSAGTMMLRGRELEGLNIDARILAKNNELNLGREARLTKAAREEYGEMVPEVYGFQKDALLMENAGSSILEKRFKDAKLVEESVLSEEETVKLSDWAADAFKKMSKGDIMHADINRANIVFKREGNDVKFKLIDFGVAFSKKESSNLRAITEQTDLMEEGAERVRRIVTTGKGELEHDDAFRAAYLAEMDSGTRAIMSRPQNYLLSPLGIEGMGDDVTEFLMWRRQTMERIKANQARLSQASIQVEERTQKPVEQTQPVGNFPVKTETTQRVDFMASNQRSAQAQMFNAAQGGGSSHSAFSSVQTAQQGVPYLTEVNNRTKKW
jgi:endonuclease YncB( thermonuclease family)/predicted Ser/Thr protein kinase